jgi:hypothetical protein
MKTKLNIEGDETHIHRSAPTFVLHETGKKKKVGGSIKIGGETHIHVHTGGEGRSEPERRPEKKHGNVFAEEVEKFNQAKAKKEETQLRKNIQDTLTKLEGAQEAVRRHQFLVLLHGSERFRRDVGWVGNPKDIFGNDAKALAKVMNNPTLKKQIQEKARKADELWRKHQLIPQYTGELERIARERPGLIRKFNYEGLWQGIGKEFEKGCKAIGLDRFAFQFNPAELTKLWGTYYIQDIMKKRHLTLVGAQKNVDKYSGMRDHYERKRRELRDTAAAYAEQEKRRAKK